MRRQECVPNERIRQELRKEPDVTEISKEFYLIKSSKKWS